LDIPEVSFQSRADGVLTIERLAFCVSDLPDIASVIVPERSPSVADGVVIAASSTILRE
jgi:hypothetical protein